MRRLLALLAAVAWAAAPPPPAALINRGADLWAQGALPEALAAFDQAADAPGPLQASAHANAAAVLAALGRPAAALERQRAASAADPADWELASRLAGSLEAQGDDEGALAAYSRAAAARPDSAALAFNAAAAQHRLRRFPLAAEGFARALELDPGMAEARHYLGVALFSDGRFADALQAFEKPAARGHALMRLGDYDAAAAEYRAALAAAADDDWLVHHSLARAHVLRGDAAATRAALARWKGAEPQPFSFGGGADGAAPDHRQLLGVVIERPTDFVVTDMQPFGRRKAHVARPAAAQPTGAVAILCCGDDADLADLQALLPQIAANFPARYPVFVFHDGYLDRAPPLQANVVRVRFPEPPAGTPDRVSVDGSSYSLGYRHMCRFFAAQLYQQPELADFEYVLRLDTDSAFPAAIRTDLFALARNQNKSYVFAALQTEPLQAIAGLDDVLAPPPADSWAAELGADTCVYTNFELSRRALWTSPAFLEMMRAVDDSGGIYSRRWGDACIHTRAAARLLSAADVLFLPELPYWHQWHVGGGVRPDARLPALRLDAPSGDALASRGAPARLVGLAMRREGREREAEHWLRRAVLVEGDCTPPLPRTLAADALCAAWARIEAGDLEAAYDVYQREPADPSNWARLAQALARFEDWEAVVAAVRRSLPAAHPVFALTLPLSGAEVRAAAAHRGGSGSAGTPALRQGKPSQRFGFLTTDPPHSAAGFKSAALAAAMRDAVVFAPAEAAGVRADVVVHVDGHAGTRDVEARDRLLRQPLAPVQMVGVGYHATVGMPAVVQFLVGDAVTTPPETARREYAEKLALLPFAVAAEPMPPPAPPPAPGGLTVPEEQLCYFGRVFKLSPPVLDAWASLLRRWPGATLALLDYPDMAPRAPARLRAELAARGVLPSRLRLLPLAPRADRFRAKARACALALDAAPYASHSTGYEALRAGVPLLAPLGAPTSVGRVAASAAAHLGLGDVLRHASVKDMEDVARVVARLGRPRVRAADFSVDGWGRAMEAAGRAAVESGGGGMHVVVPGGSNI